MKIITAALVLLLLPHKLCGVSSWYGPGFNGHRTASGEIFNERNLTAAHKTLPMGTILLVTNVKNHKSVIVKIQDRGPYIKGRILDLSKAAAQRLDFNGLAMVKCKVIR